jgi:hypothetical protein
MGTVSVLRVCGPLRPAATETVPFVKGTHTRADTEVRPYDRDIGIDFSQRHFIPS